MDKQLSFSDLQFSSIRRATVDEVEYFSLVDVMAEFSDLGSDPRVLWNRTKKRLEKDGFSVVSQVIQLKLQARDGKFYETDCADGKTVLRIIQSIPSKRAEPVREWLAELGYRELQSMAARKRAVEIDRYEREGYGNHPEVQRLKDRDMNIAVFNSLKATIAKVCKHPKWGQIINAEYQAMFDETAETLRIILETKNPRDGLPSLQLAWLTAAERTIQAALTRSDSLTHDQIVSLIESIVKPIGRNLREICKQLGIHPITGKPLLSDGRNHEERQS